MKKLMKQTTILLLLLFVGITAKAESSLIVQPLIGNEQTQVLSTIGYLKVTSDSLFIYSHSDMLLGKHAIKEIRCIRYGEPDTHESIDNVNVTTCNIYPNPTQEHLIVDNANGDNAFIFDVNGKLLQTTAIDGNHAIINVRALPNGNYLLLINTQTYKFIKQ